MTTHRRLAVHAVIVGLAAPIAIGGSATAGDENTVTVLTIGYPDADQTDPVTGSRVPGIDNLEAAFENEYPDIDLEIVNIAWGDGASSYTVKTEAMLQSNQACIYEMPGVLEYARRGLLVDLDTLIADDPEFDNVWGDQLDLARSWGPTRADTLWYIPNNTGARVIHWDAELFEDFGVEPLSATPTLEELEQKAAQLTGTNPVTGEETYGWWYQGKYAVWQFLAVAHAMGADWGTVNDDGTMSIDWDTPEFETALTWFVEMAQYAPAGALGGDGMPNGFLSEQNNVAIIPDGEPGYFLPSFIADPSLAERFRTSTNVKGADGRGGLNAFSPMAMAESCANKSEAWTVLKWLAGSDAAERYYFESIGRIPVVVDGAEIVPEIADLPDGEPILAQVQTSDAVYPWAATEPRWALQAALEAALAGNVSPAEALEQAQQETADWLAEQS